MTPAPGDQTANPLQAVSDALRRRDPQGAAVIAERALAAGLSHPLLLTARAMALSETGRHDEALAEFRAAEAMGPPNPSLKGAIALCLTRMERFLEAIAEYDAVLALVPGSAQLHCRKGWTCEQAGDLETARRAHEQAVALEPRYTEALARLAFLAARRADWDEARDFAGRALALDPRQSSARLALAIADLEGGALTEAEQRLTELLAESHKAGYDRCLAAGLMGDLRDRQGRTDEAYGFYREASEAVLALPQPPTRARAMLETVQVLRRHFEAMLPRSRLTDASGPQPLFVLGFLRSGTTLIQEVLGARDDTVVLDEKGALADAVDAFMTDVKGLDKLWAADAATLATYRALYWQRVREFGIDPEGRTLIDKMPFATIRIPLIARLFPQATIVFAMRDPRDVVWGCFRQRFTMNATTRELLTLEGAARLYDETMRLAELYREKLSPKVFDLRLEDLIDDFDGRTRALCDFAGLPFQDSMRDFAGRGHAITTPSSIQIARGLNRRGVGQWRRYARQMEPVLPILAPWVARFGYDTDEPSGLNAP
jgi:tetratricopeptide (TPR) repeat protein